MVKQEAKEFSLPTEFKHPFVPQPSASRLKILVHLTRYLYNECGGPVHPFSQQPRQVLSKISMNFYYEASSVLERLDEKRGSIKGILGSLPEKSRKRTAALVIQTLKYKGALFTIIENASLVKNEKKHLSSINLALLLVHDLLFTKGGIQASDGPIKQAVLRHKTRLQAELVKLKVKRGASTNQELASEGDARAAQIPRYVRVNTIKWTTEDALEHLIGQGMSPAASPFDSSLSFVADEHVPDLLCFHPSATFHEDNTYAEGKLILQDKASCFPALVLAPDAHEDMVALDATAAPGNKTTHLSMIMRNKGKVLALERDRRRFATLQTMIARAGCHNVEASNLDFLSTDPLASQYARVSHILLDPSCSGSGIVNRLDYLLDTEEESDQIQEERLGKLGAFQLMMIKHAMKFPRVVKIVYSTCSIHAAENEHVIVQALDSDEARTGEFTLAPREKVLPAWKRRGLKEEMGRYSDLAGSLVRCVPGEDGTNGFFVSCFIRNPSTPNPTTKSAKRKAADHELSNGDMGDGKDYEGQTTNRGRKRKKRKSRLESKST